MVASDQLIPARVVVYSHYFSTCIPAITCAGFLDYYVYIELTQSGDFIEEGAIALTVLLLVIAAPTAIVLRWLRLRVQTRIDNEGITVFDMRGRPFTMRWEEIESIRNSFIRSPSASRSVFIIRSSTNTVRVVDWYRVNELRSFIEARTKTRIEQSV